MTLAIPTPNPTSQPVQDEIESDSIPPRRRWYSWRFARASALDDLRADLKQADKDAGTWENEATKWADEFCREQARAEEETKRAHKADARAQEAEDQLDHLRRRLSKETEELQARTDEAARLRTERSAVVAELSRLAGMDERASLALNAIVLLAITGEGDEMPLLNLLSEVQPRPQALKSTGHTNTAKFGPPLSWVLRDRLFAVITAQLGPERPAAEGVFDYTHQSVPALLSDHLGEGRCRACATALPVISDDDLFAAYHFARDEERNAGAAMMIADELIKRDGDAPGRRFIRLTGINRTCVACGRRDTADDPLVLVEGAPIHKGHTTDPTSGFFGKTGETLPGWRPAEVPVQRDRWAGEGL